jgi:uncharacterized SAM-binding protein YcdF (DUF218 family)
MVALTPEAQNGMQDGVQEGMQVQSATAAPARRRRRGLVLSLAAGALALSAMLGAGFAWFATSVPADEIRLDRRADGIVVLTGGSSRIADAIELLASGHGQRLLITGVHYATRSGAISRLLPEHQYYMRCCVDLDHTATNTLGNAVQTRRWAQERGFRSLIVVTSNYHMPRAMAELGHQLPAIQLIPFPVVPEKLRGEPWWHGAKARLLLSEYVKYVYAMARMRLDPEATPESSRFSHLPSRLLRISVGRSPS